MPDSQNVLQTRDFKAYIAPYGSSNAMPTDSAYGTAWGGVYRDIGYTDGGLGFNVETTFEDVLVDQSIDAIGVIPTGRNVQLTAQAAEFTLQNLKDATSQGTLSTVAASSGVRGHTDLAFDNSVVANYLTAGFDVKHSLGDGESFRIMAWRAQVRSAVAATFTAGGKAILPYTLQAFPDPNNANRILTVRDMIPALP